MTRMICTLIFVSALAMVTATRAEYVDDPSFSVCTNATGYYDINATNDWRQRLRSSDAAAMAEIAGKWYAEFQNQQMGMVYNNVLRYTPQGVIDFTTKTCSVVMGYQRCTDDYGHGLFTAHRDPNGWIFVTRNLTSLTRINQCGGFFVRMDGDVMVTQDGTRWQRMK